MMELNLDFRQNGIWAGLTGRVRVEAGRVGGGIGVGETLAVEEMQTSSHVWVIFFLV